jgi:hypothetical protein
MFDTDSQELDKHVEISKFLDFVETLIYWRVIEANYCWSVRVKSLVEWFINPDIGRNDLNKSKSILIL